MTLLRTTWRLIRSRRFFLLFVLPNLAFAVVAFATISSNLIPVLNLIVLALGIGVCTAFFSSSVDAILAERRLDKADLLVIGIFTSWAALVLRTAWSVVWRWFGMPIALVNNDFASYFIFMSAMAGIYHLAAPGALKEQVPPKRWIMIGAIVAVGIMTALLILYAADVRTVMQIVAGPHDLFGAPTR